MKNLIPIIIVAIFSGCGKRDITPTVYVSGHLYESCGSAPVKNQGLSIFQSNANSYTSPNILATGSTDSTGYFKIPYGTTDPMTKIELRLSGTNYAVTTLPLVLTTIDDLKVYEVSTCDIVVRLNVINPYTANDTLKITNFNPPYVVLKIPGPFVSGTLYSASNFQILSPDYIGSGETGVSNQEIRYMINNNPTISVKQFLMKSCATNEVTVDIQ